MPTIRRQDKTWMQKVGRWTRPLHAPLVPLAGRALYFVLRTMPFALVAPAARKFAMLAAPLVWLKVRHRAHQNLAIAFPELTPGGRRRLFRRAFASQAVVLFETMALTRSADLVRRRTANAEEYAAALAEARAAGCGVLVLSAHVGGWELLGFHSSLEAPFIAIAKRNGPAIDALLSRIRGAFGLRIQYHDESPRELLRQLQGGGAVGIIADRTFKGVATVDVPFFGEPAPFPKVPMTLARKTGAPLLFTIVLRDPDGRYHLELEGPISPVGTDDAEADARALLERWVAFVERVIRAHPEAWVPLAGHWKHLSCRERAGSSAPAVT